ncbi:MAG: hypothetical protein MSS75_04535 [Megasphaera sp.]|nr:hypothetical protein [Megasphaera sp.]MCI7600297.1 hypothetical protein [Megasphaera sp.]
MVTAGRGWYQEWGKPAQELHAGDVVHIPANVKHCTGLPLAMPKKCITTETWACGTYA